jgi:hypothetical protein
LAERADSQTISARPFIAEETRAALTVIFTVSADILAIAASHSRFVAAEARTAFPVKRTVFVERCTPIDDAHKIQLARRRNRLYHHVGFGIVIRRSGGATFDRPKFAGDAIIEIDLVAAVRGAVEANVQVSVAVRTLERTSDNLSY